jgi:hypothetical protein
MLFLWVISRFPTHFRLRGKRALGTISRVGFINLSLKISQGQIIEYTVDLLTPSHPPNPGAWACIAAGVPHKIEMLF